MTNKEDLLAQQAELTKQQQEIDKKLKDLLRQERSDALKMAISLIHEHEFTQQELFVVKDAVKKQKATVKVAAKYRDPISGNEWSGRGVSPKWISSSGKHKDEFLIA